VIRSPRSRHRAGSRRTILAAGRLAALALSLVACGGDLPGEVPSQPDAGAASGSQLPPLPVRPSILLVTVDTLRADRLGAWGAVRDTSPVLDALAAEGVRFAAAQVQWPKTGPSFASMFTATYPKDNGIARHVGIPLPCAFRTLAEELSALGYRTEAVVANGAVGREFNFDQGFDGYLETWKIDEDPDLNRWQRARRDPNRAGRVTDLALEVADRLDRDRPYFLWVHYLDPHAPYQPPRSHRDLFQGDAHFDPAPRVSIDSRRSRREIGAIGKSDAVDGREDLAFYLARYDAEIRYTDEEIGRLLAGLTERGLASDRLTVFTSDHGESLGEHNYFFGHGRLAFQTCLHVPLLFHWPGVLAPGVDEDPVELIHLAPTLLEIAGRGLTEGRWAQGGTLVERLRGRGASPEGARAYSEAGYAQRGKWIRALRERRMKLVYAPHAKDQQLIGGEGVQFALYDLETDPGESVNLAAERPEELARLKRTLWEWDRAPRFDAETDTASCGEGRPVDRETEELLRSLGYL